MGPLLSTRLASSALPMADGARCFYAYYLCGELVKTARADAMISVNQLVNQYSCLVSSLSPSLVSLSGAGRLLLALRCLISDRFCIIPVGSGIEHFFQNNAAVLRFPTCLPIGVSVLASLSLGTAFPAARAVSARVMSSISAGCLLVAVSSVPLIRLVPRPVVRVVPRFARLSHLTASPHHAYPSGMSVSSHPLILPALATPARLTLLVRPVPRVAGRGVPRLALISSCVSSAVSAFRLSSSRRAYRYTECCGDGDRRMWGIRASVP